MDDLDYEKHLEEYKLLGGFYADSSSNRKKNLEWAEKKAQYIHSLYVHDTLRDWFTNTNALAQKLTNNNAQYYMLHGAGRRLSMMFRAYRGIISPVHPERTDPLHHEEQQNLSRDINILYMHLRGVLDNFAWCLMYERQPDLADKINKRDISLFSTKFRKQCIAFSEIVETIQVHDDWDRELKERRDPVAHRIPLYVPPAVVTPEQLETYKAAYKRFEQNMHITATSDADEAFEEMHIIGTLFPVFVHHPKEAPIPIYPTIPNDIVHLIRIGNVVKRALLNQKKED